MDPKNFNDIFKNISGSLYCPACGKKYDGTEVKNMFPNDGGLVVSISCSKCKLPVMINILTKEFISNNTTAPLSLTDTDITYDEIISFHDSLKVFDGDFRKAFGRD